MAIEFIFLFAIAELLQRSSGDRASGDIHSPLLDDSRMRRVRRMRVDDAGGDGGGWRDEVSVVVVRAVVGERWVESMWMMWMMWVVAQTASEDCAGWVEGDGSSRDGRDGGVRGCDIGVVTNEMMARMVEGGGGDEGGQDGCRGKEGEMHFS